MNAPATWPKFHGELQYQPEAEFFVFDANVADALDFAMRRLGTRCDSIAIADGIEDLERRLSELEDQKPLSISVVLREHSHDPLRPKSANFVLTPPSGLSWVAHLI